MDSRQRIVGISVFVGAAVAVLAWAGCGEPTKPGACTQNSDCSGGQVCDVAAASCVTPPTVQDAGVGKETACADGQDNDGDTAVDCADTDCANVTCRAAVGLCDVEEVCTGGACPADAFKPATTECAAAACADGSFTAARTCDGNGNCAVADPTSCLPFACTPAGCNTLCGSNTDCGAGFKCSGTNCVSETALAIGEACSLGSQCESGFCVDGVCCDGQCTGSCNSCALAASKGTCTFVAEGEDGDPSCAPYTCAGTSANCYTACSTAAECADGHRCSNNVCVPLTANGSACVAGEECASGSCADGVCCNTACTGACESCDSAGKVGTCTAAAAGSAGDPSCAPFVCSGVSGACPSACTGNADCAGGLTCASNGQCKKPNGQTCSAASECTSGFCADGVCCTGACSGACESCNATGKVGTCSPAAAGSAGAPSCAPFVCSGTSGACPTACTGNSDCAGGLTCASNGQCKKPNGQTCSAASDCTSGFCADGVCCNSACAGACNACAQSGSVGTCTNLPAGSAGNPSCSPYVCGGAASCGTTCTADSQCAAGHWCSSNTCVPKVANGASCGDNRACTSGFCVDGVCCNSSCTGACRACDVGGSLGTCTNFADNTDPDNECGGTTCNGAGACSATCTASNSCTADCKSGYFCNSSSQCAPDKANGNGCNAGCECTSGTCTTYYADSDGDGYGNPGVTVKVCGTGPVSGHVSNSSDCCDSDARAKPGQTAYYSAANNCGSFDYNCNGTAEREFTGINTCPEVAVCGVDCNSGNVDGWASTVPGCGASASWRSCEDISCFTPTGIERPRCAGVNLSQTQTCR